MNIRFLIQFLMASGFFLTTNNYSQQFEYLGLAGKNITSLSVNYNLIAVGTDSSGVYWQNESTVDSTEWDNIPLNRTILSVYPHKSGPIGWAISAGVEKSLSDSGLIFCSYLGGEFVSNSSGIDCEHSFSVRDIDGFPDPTICGETYAVTGDALYLRKFGDSTWTKIREAWEGGFNCVKVKEEYPGVVMLGGATGFAGILLEKSTDFGETWDNISPFGAVADIDFTGDSAGVIFAAAYPDVFRTTDNGANWEKIFVNNEQYIINRIVYSENYHFLVAAGFEGLWNSKKPVLFCSPDWGEMWFRTNLDFDDEIMGLEYSSNGGDWVYVASRESGVYRFNPFIVSADETPLPISTAKFKLFGNYPNPFNPETMIKYSVSKTIHLELSVYDVLGRKIVDLVNETVSPGEYEVNFEAGALASGIYYCKLSSGSFSETKKMMLLR